MSNLIERKREREKKYMCMHGEWVRIYIWKNKVWVYTYTRHINTTHTCVSFFFFIFFTHEKDTKEQRRQNKIYICIGISRVDDLFMIGQKHRKNTHCDSLWLSVRRCLNDVMISRYFDICGKLFGEEREQTKQKIAIRI